MHKSTVLETVIQDGDEEAWEAPTVRPHEDYDSEEEVVIDAKDFDENNNGSSQDASSEKELDGKIDVGTNVKAEDEYADMEDEALALDESTINDSSTDLKKQSPNDMNPTVSNTSNAIIRSRRYDVSITYDNYYRTPRIWLFGYDANGSPLTPEAVFQDVMQDYAKKTVTIDPHPHLSIPCASIHPCQHGPAMQRILKELKDCGKSVTVEAYLFIFLKFIQSVVPTIEYDYTMDVQIRATNK
jgi:ubiquitin-like-conjugating enzyme ATG3